MCHFYSKAVPINVVTQRGGGAWPQTGYRCLNKGSKLCVPSFSENNLFGSVV